MIVNTKMHLCAILPYKQCFLSPGETLLSRVLCQKMIAIYKMFLNVISKIVFRIRDTEVVCFLMLTKVIVAMKIIYSKMVL